MYDAIIVGARCAGAATAMLLARAGHRVLLLDRDAYPSDTISGHFIVHPGVRKLAEWGLLDAVLATGSPAVNQWSAYDGEQCLTADVTPADIGVCCVGPRRIVLDQLLVDAAIGSGAEFRDRSQVVALLGDGDRVSGVRIRTTQAEAEERAAIIVGADGKHSFVARQVGAPTYGEVPSLTCWYMAYWEGLPLEGIEGHQGGNRLVLAFPTNDDLTMVAIGWRHARMHGLRQDIEGGYRQGVEETPGLASRFANARRVEPFQAMADLPTFFRKPWGPGWALVGDAGHHKDPTNARGISDAFCDAALLAEAIDAGLQGRKAMDEALAGYHRDRDVRAIPDNAFNLERARLESDPQEAALRGVLRDQPAQARRLFEAICGMIPPGEFFNPGNIGAIMAKAAVGSPGR